MKEIPMPAVEASKTVRELILANPTAARTFEQFGIDYCCGSNKSLLEACASARVPVEQVIGALEEPRPIPDGRDWQIAPLEDLTRHIVEKHHAFTREELKRLTSLLAKVVAAHGINHPELASVQSVFRGLHQELTMHMMKEEQILFPYIEEMEAAVNAKRSLPSCMFGTVQNPVRMMMMEHDSAGDAFREMRTTTNSYTVPADGCVSYHELYRALSALEADLHEHIHLENNILFPRSIQMEQAAF
jgi:regulator of cell morphogenesis and NO signaling